MLEGNRESNSGLLKSPQYGELGSLSLSQQAERFRLPRFATQPYDFSNLGFFANRRPIHQGSQQIIKPSYYSLQNPRKYF